MARRRQGAALGRVHFAPGELGATLARLGEAVVRPVSGVAYVPDEVAVERSEPVHRLEERIRAAFDPRGVLAG